MRPLAQIDERDIRLALENAPEAQGLNGSSYIHASVLIPFIKVEGEWHLLFTRRTDRVETHKGQVAFPGGAADPVDTGVVDTALRETTEEIGIPSSAVRILGQMSPFPTMTGFLITPIVGLVSWPVDLQVEEAEVSRVFSIPLSWLADPHNYEERLYQRSNGVGDMVVFYKYYDDELLWGITARITVDLIALLQK
jgi:8-oxo-dGTP pyrophosphatase MutT (NUDIX family)